MEVKNIITAVIGGVVGVALLPVLTSSIAEANATGVTATLLKFLPTLYVIVLISGMAYYVYTTSKK